MFGLSGNGRIFVAFVFYLLPLQGMGFFVAIISFVTGVLYDICWLSRSGGAKFQEHCGLVDDAEICFLES